MTRSIDVIQEDISRKRQELDTLLKELSGAMSIKSRDMSAYYEKEKDELEKTGDWLNTNNILQVGDVVKITGSRAGTYRKIISVQYYTIIGNPVNEHKVKNPDGSYTTRWMVVRSCATSQRMDKITHILRSGKFVPVKQLMEDASK